MTWPGSGLSAVNLSAVDRSAVDRPAPGPDSAGGSGHVLGLGHAGEPHLRLAVAALASASSPSGQQGSGDRDERSTTTMASGDSHRCFTSAVRIPSRTSSPMS